VEQLLLLLRSCLHVNMLICLFPAFLATLQEKPVQRMLDFDFLCGAHHCPYQDSSKQRPCSCRATAFESAASAARLWIFLTTSTLTDIECVSFCSWLSSTAAEYLHTVNQPMGAAACRTPHPLCGLHRTAWIKWWLPEGVLW
jgi:hypothetical protein